MCLSVLENFPMFGTTIPCNQTTLFLIARQAVASIKLLGIQAQRDEHLVLRLGQHIAPLVDQAEIEVCLWTARAKPNSKPQRISCRVKAAILE